LGVGDGIIDPQWLSGFVAAGHQQATMGAIRMVSGDKHHLRDALMKDVRGPRTIEDLLRKMCGNIRSTVHETTEEATIMGMRRASMNEFLNTFRINTFYASHWLDWRPEEDRHQG
jgi:hypothetical protein